MRFLFATGSLYTYGIDRCFALAARAGFDGIELMVDHRWDTRQPAYVQQLIDRYELPVLAVHTPFMLNVPGWPAPQHERIFKTVEIAEALGAEVVVHHLPMRIGDMVLQMGSRRLRLPAPFRWDPEAGYRRWLQDEYRAYKKTMSVTLCIENMPALRKFGRRWRLHHWNTPEQIAQFPHLTMDTTHLGTWGLEPATVYTLWNNRVRHVHLSNFDGREHRLPEAGSLHLDHLLRQLAADGYDGNISLELHPDAVSAGNSDAAIVKTLASSLDRCRTWAG